MNYSGNVFYIFFTFIKSCISSNTILDYCLQEYPEPIELNPDEIACALSNIKMPKRKIQMHIGNNFGL